MKKYLLRQGSIGFMFFIVSLFFIECLHLASGEVPPVNKEKDIAKSSNTTIISENGAHTLGFETFDDETITRIKNMFSQERKTVTTLNK
jgi:hypothetical protein